MIYGNRLLNWANLAVVFGLVFLYFVFYYQIKHDYFGAYHHYYLQYFYLLFFGWLVYRATRTTVYFELEGGHFTARNYLRPWADSYYLLSDIDSIQIKKLMFAGACALYITHKNGEQQVFASGVLTEADWKDLIRDLHLRGFDVSYVGD